MGQDRLRHFSYLNWDFLIFQPLLTSLFIQICEKKRVIERTFSSCLKFDEKAFDTIFF